MWTISWYKTYLRQKKKKSERTYKNLCGEKLKQLLPASKFLKSNVFCNCLIMQLWNQGPAMYKVKGFAKDQAKNVKTQ